MKTNLVSSENGKRQIHLLAELLRYGIEWNQNLDLSDYKYRLGGLETIAFMFSCCVVQWFGLDAGCGASDIMVLLDLESFAEKKTSPSIKTLERKITNFLLEINE